jgi:hypothetical protein
MIEIAKHELGEKNIALDNIEFLSVNYMCAYSYTCHILLFINT